MANIPFNLSKSQSQIFKDSGAEILLELGALLYELNVRGDFEFRNTSNRQENEIIADIEKKEAEVLEFFENKQSARLRKIILCKQDNRSIVSIDCARPIALLAYCQIIHHSSFLHIMSLARWSITDKQPSAILESKRVISFLLVDNIFTIVDDCVNGLPHIRLHREVLNRFLGEEKCIALIEESTADTIQEERRKLASKAGGRRYRDTPQSHPAKNRDNTLAGFANDLPDWTPLNLSDYLAKKGYIGQDTARERVSLTVCQHIARIKWMHKQVKSPQELPPVRNMLLKGDTGSGKTFLMKLLGEVTGLPVLILDITSYSETGYVGNNIESIPALLAQVANGNFAIAEHGLVVIDEIDKLAGGSADVADRVSHNGVQRGLLKMIEGTIMDVPKNTNVPPWKSDRIPFDTSNIMWVGAGCFPLLDTATEFKNNIGFGKDTGQKPEQRTLNADSFAKAGFMPELLGRFTGGVICLDPLSPEQLKNILIKNVIEQHRHELEMQNIGLHVDNDVLDILVQQALEMKTGARSLQTTLNKHLYKGSFAAYSVRNRRKTIHLFALNREIKWKVDVEKPIGVTSNVNSSNNADELQPICRAG